MRGLAAAFAVACAWDPPRDPGAAPWDNVLAGEVVLTAGGDPSEAWVTLFAADDLGPPYGTGRPTTFTVVGRDAFTDGGATLVAADWTLTGIPDGSWSVAALLDRDHDFHPLVDPMAGATCGDVVGAHIVSAAAPVPAALEVAGGEVLDDVVVLLGSELPIERPVFELEVAEISRAAFGVALPTFRVEAASIATAFGDELPLTLGPTCEPLADCASVAACPCVPEPCGTAIWLELRDADGDGLPDPYPAPAQAAAGLLDIWPRVFLSLVVGTSEVDGVPLTEQYVTEAAPLLLEILGAAAYGLPPSAVAPVGTPTPLRALSVSVLPSFRHYHARGSDGIDAKGPYDEISDPSVVPDGPWTVTLISSTGQTWTVPNASADGPVLDDAFRPGRQGEALTFGP